MKKLKLGTRLYTLIATLLLFAILLGIVSLVGIRKTNQGLETVYNDRVVPLKQLKTIADAYAVSIIDAANKANAGIVTAEDTLKSVASANEQITKNWTDYMATTLTSEEVRLAQEAKQLFGAADAAAAKFQQGLAGKSGSVKGTLDDFDGPLYSSIDPISAKITELIDLQLRVAESEYHAAHDRYSILLWLAIGLLVASTTVGGGMGWWMVRSITKPIKAVADLMSNGAEQVASAAGQVSSSSQSLAEGASEQAASIEETSASIEEMSSMTKRNAENASKAYELARQARVAAERGSADMQAMNLAMDAIKASSDDIAKIIKTIDEIAFQTNILALNAAVEAARAGEAGMGFAVVADEVRSLAQRSAQAAKETSAKIEGAISRTAQGVDISAKVTKALAEIVTQARQVDELAAEVAGASREQSQGITQINLAVGQMDKVTQSNAANAEESAAASEELNAQAGSMRGTVAELLQLVNGSHIAATTSRPPVLARSPKFKPDVTAAPSASVRANGNGHTRGSTPAAPLAVGRQTSPSDGNLFTDF